MRLRLLAAVPLLLLPLTACGDDTADSAGGAASDTPSSADPNACTSIWVAGSLLPEGYTGCTDNGAQVAAKKRNCSFGKPLVTYGDAFYAVPGGKINQVSGTLGDDEGYQASLAACTG